MYYYKRKAINGTKLIESLELNNDINDIYKNIMNSSLINYFYHNKYEETLRFNPTDPGIENNTKNNNSFYFFQGTNLFLGFSLDFIFNEDLNQNSFYDILKKNEEKIGIEENNGLFFENETLKNPFHNEDNKKIRLFLSGLINISFANKILEYNQVFNLTLNILYNFLEIY